MLRTNNLYAGWVDAAISELVDSSPDWLSNSRFALITSLDSVSNLREVAKIGALVEAHRELVFLGGGVVAPTAAVEILSRDGAFTGFDELWLFDVEPRVAKPSNTGIVAPWQPEEPLSPELLRWFNDSKCKLGLGDGAGTSFLTADSSLGTALDSHDRR